MSKAAELAALIGSQTALSNRNLIINGAMTVSQRGTSAVNSSSSGTYRVDRFKAFSSGGGVFTTEQSSTVPNNEFAYSNKLTVTTADSSIASADFYAFNHDIEGYNIIQTGYGTSDAKTLTLSFWVRSSVTGTYSVTAYNSDGSRGYLNTFSISSVDTWTKISLSWAGDTGGTWNKTNGTGITIRFDLGGGSAGHGTADQWTTSGTFAANRTSGSVDWIATSGATFYITGIQLEVGETATPFEHEDYGTTLAKCQRYYQIIQGVSGNQIEAATGVVGTSTSVFRAMGDLKVTMRAAPTLSATGLTAYDGSSNPTVNLSTSYSTPNHISFDVNGGVSLTVGRAGIVLIGANAANYFDASAEL
jgi:hypothetical protein